MKNLFLKQTKLQNSFWKIALLSLGAVFFLCHFVFAQTPKGKNRYEIGVLADRGKEIAVKQWMPVADYLTQNIPEAYFTILPLNYDEIDLYVETGIVDFVVANPLILIEMEYFSNVQRLASLKHVYRAQELSGYGSVVFTKADRDDIVDFRDLEDKKIAAVHSRSYGGWVLAMREMQDQKLNMDKVLSSVHFLGSDDAVVNAVFNKGFDIGIISTSILEMMINEGLMVKEQIKVLHARKHMIEAGTLHSTDFFPGWSIAKLGHIEDRVGKAVAAALLRASDDPVLRKRTLFARWTVPYSYSTVRKSLRDIEKYNDIGFSRPWKLVVKDYWLLFIVVIISFFYMIGITAHRLWLNKNLQKSKEILEKELKEHKRAEKSLRESRGMLQAVLDLIPARVFWKDVRSIFLGGNKMFVQDAGLKDVTEMIGKTDYDMVWAEQADHYVEDDKKVMSGGRPVFNIIEPQTHSDGSKIWLRTHKIPMRDEEGEVIGLLGTYEDITEAKKTQEALEKSEFKYRELVENANSIILRLNNRGEIIFFNEYAQRFFGFSEEEIIGKSAIGTIVPKEDSQGNDLTVMVEEVVKKMISGEGEGYHVNENENITKNGERVWIAWSNKVIVNEMGDKEILSIGTDMTDRRKMEEELLRLSYAMEQSQNIVIITDEKANIQYVNPKFTEITGYSKEEAVGKNPRFLKSGEVRSGAYKELWRTILAGGTWRGEFHNRKKNGDLYWERATISPLKNRQGDITGFLGIKEDVSNERKLMQDLQKAFGRLKEMERIINLSNAIVFMWSPAKKDMPVKFVSDNIRTLGWAPEDFYVRGMKINDLIFEDDRETFSKTIKRNVKAQRLEFFHQYRVKTRDNKICWFEDHSFVTYDKNGNPEFIQGVAFDITERRIAEERMLEAVNMKSEFISIVSHELRTPLTAIKESINIVVEREAGQLNEDQSRFLGIAKRNVDRLGKLINDVLDYQKLDMGKLTFDWQDIDVREPIHEVFKTMEIVASNKGLDFRLKLPAGDFPKVHADADRIIQVLNNLINNAIKFTEKGFVEIELLDREDNYIQVMVTDTGIGIRTQDMHKLFQTFSQVRTGSERQSGETGLGLAISKKIINSHGGSIWAESVYGKGTTISFILPIVA